MKRIFDGEADRAVKLAGLVDRPLDNIACKDSRRVDEGDVVSGRPVEQQAGAVQHRAQLGQPMLHRLKASQRPAELHARPDMLDREVHRAVGRDKGLGDGAEKTLVAQMLRSDVIEHSG